MNVVLIGYRGSGKTTLGKLLAKEMDRPFVDLDDLITSRAGMTVREMFEKHGEPYFRQLESDALLEAIARTNHVLSLGGGAILAERNRQAIANAGHLVVYLRADAEELHRRIVADTATAAQRPGLTHLGGSIEEVRQLLAGREPLYQQLKTLELDVNSNNQRALVEQLLLKIRSATPGSRSSGYFTTETRRREEDAEIG